MLARIALEQLARCPFDREEVQPIFSFTDLDRAHYIRVYDAGTVLSFPDKTGNGRSVQTKFFSQDLQRNSAVGLVRGSIDRRSPALANLTLDSVPGYL